MADRLSTQVLIGGDIPESLVPGLCEVICAEGLALDYGARCFRPDTAEELQAAVPAGETLQLCDEHAPWGRFEQLEKFLEQHQIAFTRRCEGRYEYPPQLVEYRPGYGPVTLETNAGGYPVVLARDLVPVRHLLEAALEAADGQPDSRTLSLMQAALKELREQMPPELPPLEPFRVVPDAGSTTADADESPPGMQPHTNRDRAARAERALTAYGMAAVPDRDDRLTDLLTDLRHYCHRRDMDWNGALEIVAMHFKDERAGE